MNDGCGGDEGIRTLETLPGLGSEVGQGAKAWKC